MERMTPSELHTAASIAAEEGQFADFNAAVQFVSEAESRARSLHTLYTRACNRPLTEREERATERHEAALKAAFALHGLGLYLNGDPRGNPVGILTPKSGRYNTMGGSECGWRL